MHEAPFDRRRFHVRHCVSSSLPALAAWAASEAAQSKHRKKSVPKPWPLPVPGTCRTIHLFEHYTRSEAESAVLRAPLHSCSHLARDLFDLSSHQIDYPSSGRYTCLPIADMQAGTVLSNLLHSILVPWCRCFQVCLADLRGMSDSCLG